MRRVLHAGPVRYRPPGPGPALRGKIRGTLELPDGQKVAPLDAEKLPVRTATGAMILVPRRDIKPEKPRPALPSRRRDRMRQAICCIHATLPPGDGAPIVFAPTAYNRTHLHPLPEPMPPIEDEAYLAWIRSLPSLRRAPGEQRSPTRPHHYGPRGVSQKCDDWRTVPLDQELHDFFHGPEGTLPGLTVEETRILFLATEIKLLLQYFAGVLGDDAHFIYQTASAINCLPPEQRQHHLRMVLEWLVSHLRLLTGRRRVGEGGG